MSICFFLESHIEAAADPEEPSQRRFLAAYKAAAEELKPFQVLLVVVSNPYTIGETK